LVVGDLSVLFGLELAQRNAREVLSVEPLSDLMVRFKPIFFDVGSDAVTAYNLTDLK
jgi:hypothetical protein